MKGVPADLSRSDGARNREIIQSALDRLGTVTLPPWSVPLQGGLVLRDGRHLTGTPGTVIVATAAESTPVVHVLGSHTGIEDLTIALPPSEPGIHDGARHTAVTIGDYLYPHRPAWIHDIALRRVQVRRSERCAANSIAVMGAVHGVTLRDIDVRGGGTAIAAHWGAVASSVAEITGPSFHPYDLEISRLRVADAFEGFYLSSVHDVTVTDVDCDRVAIGYRLLPGDNADAYHEDRERSEVGSRITVSDVRARWNGLYAVRIAGWGRSEADGSIRRLAYRDTTIRSCTFTAVRARDVDEGRRATVVLESAEGVRLEGIAVSGLAVPERMIDGVVASAEPARTP